MRLEQFEFLLEISKHKSMNKASEQLHISPQALSISIKRLEEELGFLLLNRTATGVTFTEQGRALLPIISSFLKGIEDIQTRYSPSTDFLCGNMTILSPQGFAETMLPGFLAAFHKKYPEVSFSCSAHTYETLISTVSSGKADFAITYQFYIDEIDLLQDLPDTLTFHPLFPVHFECMIPKSFPIASYKTVSMKTLLNYPIIIYEPASYIVLKMISHYGSPNKLIQMPTVNSISLLLNSSSGIGLSMVNEFDSSAVVNYETTNIACVQLRDNIQGYCGYICKKDVELNTFVKTQLVFLENYFKEQRCT